MNMRTTTLAFVLVALVPAMVGGSAVADTLGPADSETRKASAEAAPLPLRWVPGWLMESLSKAIADATDPRDRASDKQAARGG